MERRRYLVSLSACAALGVPAAVLPKIAVGKLGMYARLQGLMAIALIVLSRCHEHKGFLLLLFLRWGSDKHSTDQESGLERSEIGLRAVLVNSNTP